MHTELHEILSYAKLIEEVLDHREGHNPHTGECYIASVVLMEEFNSPDLYLVKKKDHEGRFHWWVKYCDGDEVVHIDITKSQYHRQNLPSPSDNPRGCFRSNKMRYSSYKYRVASLKQEIHEYATMMIEMEAELSMRY